MCGKIRQAQGCFFPQVMRDNDRLLSHLWKVGSILYLLESLTQDKTLNEPNSSLTHVP